jgi:Domain of unknown function (DUF5658)
MAAIVTVLPIGVFAQERSPEDAPAQSFERERPPSRLFTALATTFAGLNALDVVSTERVIQTGRGEEANPVMGGAVRNPYVFAVTKAAVTTSMMIAIRRMSRQHPVRGVVFLIAADVGLGLIVAHNARVAAAP